MRYECVNSSLVDVHVRNEESSSMKKIWSGLYDADKLGAPLEIRYSSTLRAWARRNDAWEMRLRCSQQSAVLHTSRAVYMLRCIDAHCLYIEEIELPLEFDINMRLRIVLWRAQGRLRTEGIRNLKSSSTLRALYSFVIQFSAKQVILLWFRRVLSEVSEVKIKLEYYIVKKNKFGVWGFNRF